MSFATTKIKVGKYELGRTLGEGTFAKVKFAKNTETGESVAIKVLDKEKILKHKMVEQVLFSASFPLPNVLSSLTSVGSACFLPRDLNFYSVSSR